MKMKIQKSNSKISKEIYFDGAANTPVDKKVFRVMKPYLTNNYVGNSSSIHEHGINSARALMEARKTCASIFKCTPEEVYFTSGATEGNNWVIQSLALHEKMFNGMQKNHIIVSNTEHSSILNTCKELENWGFKITYLPTRQGVVSVRDLKQVIKPTTLLICIMSVNNELGTTNPIVQLSRMAKKRKVLFLCDCTQSVGYGGDNIRLCSTYPSVDYFTFSAHKIYGPTGVGCLIARKDAPLYSMIHGGSQEQGLRGGTSNLAGIIGMIQAIKLMDNKSLKKYYLDLFNYFVVNLPKDIHLSFNVMKPTHYSIMNIRLTKAKTIFSKDYTLADALINKGMACSSTSACDLQDETKDPALSHVLLAVGLTEQEIVSSARISFTKYTTKKDINKLIKALEAINKGE